MADNETFLLDPTGETVSVPDEQVDEAQQLGYTAATPEQIKEYNLQQQYGEGLGNEAKAFALGAGNAATFGGLNQGLVRTRLVDPDTIKQITERNPGAYGAGTVAGIAAPMAIGDEAGPLNLVKGVSDAGKAVEAGVAGALPEATSLAGRIASSAAAKGLGSAVEGAAYGAGQVVSEQALGDPNLTAQRAIAQVGLSGLLGGALGGVLGAGEVAIPPAVDAAKDAIGKLYDSAKGVAGDAFAKASSAVSGLPEEAISEALANRQTAFASPEARTEAANSLADSLNDSYQKVEDAAKTTFKDVRPDESAALVADANPEAVQGEATRMYKLLNDASDEMRSRPELYPARYPAKLDEMKAAFLKDLASDQSPPQVFKVLNQLKQNLDTKIKFGKIPTSEDMDAQAAIKALRGQVKDSLENEDVFGPAAARQSAFNEAYNEYATARSDFQKNFMMKTTTNKGSVAYKVNPIKVNTYFNQMGDTRGMLRSQVLDRYTKASQNLVSEIQKSYESLPAKSFDKDAVSSLIDRGNAIAAKAQKQAAMANTFKQITKGEGGLGEVAAGAIGLHNPILGAGIEAYSMLRNPGATINRLANLERLVQSTTRQIENGVKTLVSGSSKALNVGRGEISAGVAKDFGKEAEDSAKKFNKRVTEINTMDQNPNLLHEKLDGATTTLYAHAPNVSGALQRSAVAGVTFLASKVPQAPQQGPLAHEWTPSPTEIAKFNRYYEAVQNPTAILKQAAAGTLTPEGVEAVKTVYPELFDQMTSAITDRVAQKRGVVPYKSRMMLSLMMGQDMDGSTAPASILANQAALSGGAKPAQGPTSAGAARPSQKGLSSVTLADRFQTAQQASAQRGQA